jgi:hypothetical protein
MRINETLSVRDESTCRQDAAEGKPGVASSGMEWGEHSA